MNDERDTIEAGSASGGDNSSIVFLAMLRDAVPMQSSKMMLTMAISAPGAR